MDRNHRSVGCLLAVVFFILAEAAVVSTSSISGCVFEPQTSWAGGRSLLQSKKKCPIDFEFKNYTIITSQCNAPNYPAKQCCRAFKEFACPYAKQLNDLSNDCASTMFSYINLYGHYPAGLFATVCISGKGGLQCPTRPT